MSQLAIERAHADPGSTRQAITPARLLAAVAGAIALHALVLVSQRPTLIQSASMAVAPAMTVRLITPDALRGAPVEPVTAPAVEAPPVPPALERVHDAVPSPAATQKLEAGKSTVGAAAQAASAPLAAQAAPPAVAARASEAAPLAKAPPQPELPPAPAYLAGGKLDPGPRPLNDIDPAYPPEANLQEGQVVLRLLINESGDVDNVAVVRAYPKGLFDASALAAFSGAKFAPGRLMGVPVKSQVTIEVQFMPINRGAKVSGRGY